MSTSRLLALTCPGTGIRLWWPWALSDRWDEGHRPHGLLALCGVPVSERSPAQACACGQAACGLCAVGSQGLCGVPATPRRGCSLALPGFAFGGVLPFLSRLALPSNVGVSAGEVGRSVPPCFTV